MKTIVPLIAFAALATAALIPGEFAAGQEPPGDIVYNRRPVQTRSQVLPGAHGQQKVTTAAGVQATTPPRREELSARQGSVQFSPVQQRLAQMYQRDGREMPVMDISQMPGNPAYSAVADSRAVPADAYGRMPQYGEQSYQPKKKSFLEKLTPSFFKRKPSQPAPEEYEETAESTGPEQKPWKSESKRIPTTPAPRTLPYDPAAEWLASLDPNSPKPAPKPQQQARTRGSAAPPFVSPIREKPTLNDDEDLTNLDESLNLEQPRRPHSPPEELLEGSPFTGLKINPSQKDAEIADETPVLPETETPTQPETGTLKLPLDDQPGSTEEGDPLSLPSEDELPVLRTPAQEIAGLKGRCLVTLKTERKVVEGSEEHRSVYKGRIYRFASEEAKGKFDDNPAAYAPAQAGADVVKKSQGEKDADGSLDHAVWYKGQLYMFAGEETLKTFIASPGTYAK